MRHFVLAVLLSTTSFTLSAADVPPLYQKVAYEYSLPPVLLYSMALTESGSSTVGIWRPWPWTVNNKGVPHYFDTRLEAYEYLSKLVDSGYTKFDLGLMQPNWKWQQHLFVSLWDALDPHTNLRVAASIVDSYYQQLGSLEDAVGAYHSPSNKDRASAYRERVRDNMAAFLHSNEGQF